MSYRNLTSEKFCDENYVTKRAAKWTIKPERYVSRQTPVNPAFFLTPTKEKTI